MKPARRHLLKTMILSPLAILIPKPARPKTISVRACCRNCRHYEPPRDLRINCLDGPPTAYCHHPRLWRHHYVSPETVHTLRAQRRPDDYCRRYGTAPGLSVGDSLATGLNPDRSVSFIQNGKRGA